MKAFVSLVPLALLAAPAAAGPLAVDAGLARYQLAASEELLLERLDPISRATFAAALGDDYGAAAGFWSDIIAGSMQVRLEDGDTADVLWYNPLFEAGLASRWRRVGDDWQAIAATPVTAETLRGGTAVVAPVDWDRAPVLKQAIEATARADWEVARSGGWFDHGATGAGSAAIARAYAARASLLSMQAAPGYADARIRLHELLVTTPDRSLPRELAAALGRIGTDARLTLRPIAAFRRVDGWTMALQSPDAPRHLLLAHFGGGSAQASAQILGIQRVELGDGL
jgi:hypothetical protein